MEQRHPNTLLSARSIVAAFASLALISLVACIVVFVASARADAGDGPYRTINDAFATRTNSGWTLTSAPIEGRYRICGATESNPDNDADSIRGSFSIGKRSVEFDVAIPSGKVVAVEGLDPIDGGPLGYAVLTRDSRHHDH